MNDDKKELWDVFVSKSQSKQILEWKKLFKQNIKDDDIEILVGKVIRAEGTINEEGTVRPFGFEGFIIGYSKDVTFMPDRSDFAVRYTFDTDEGMGFRILHDMTWSIIKAKILPQ